MSESLIKNNYKMRLVSRDGHFNIKRLGLSWWGLFKADIYHYYLNLSWYKLLLVSLLYYTCVNLAFGGLYYVDVTNITFGESYADAFFFSVQTMSTIGYGRYAPIGIYLNSIVFIQTWIGLISDGVIVALIIAKISRPSRLRHTVKFSDCAVLNTTSSSYQVDMENDNKGSYIRSGVPTFSFRIMNMRKRQLCDPTLRLLLIRKEYNQYITHELSYDINRQVGRPRAMGFSVPHLPLPWLIVHRIDEDSPLHGVSKSDMIEGEYEIVAILDAVDELSSSSFQTRWSYVPSEIKWGHQFVNMVKRNKQGRLEMECEQLSVTETVGLNDSEDSFNPYSDETVPLSNVDKELWSS